MIVLAGGEEPRLAAGLWLVLAGRAVSAVPHVRAQVARLHGRASSAAVLAAADLVALVAAGVAVALWPALLAGAVAVASLVGLHRLGGRRSVPPAAVIGVRQAVAGLALVAVTAIGVHA